MVTVSHLNVRLLFAIIYPPKVAVNLHVFRLPARSISTSTPWLHDVSSVSFGAETDLLLEEYNKKGKRGLKSKSKSKSISVSRKSNSNGPATSQAGTNSSEPSHPIPTSELASEQRRSAFQTEFSPSIEAEIPEITTIERTRKHHVASSTNAPIALEKNRKKTPSNFAGLPGGSRALSRPTSNAGQTAQRHAKASLQMPLPSKRNREDWQIQKEALMNKLGGERWQPRKKLSPDAVQGIRELHAENPERYSTPILANQFQVSPDAIRRILKGKWRPSEKQMEDKRAKWASRHDRLWDFQSELGLRPARTGDREIEGPEVFEQEVLAKQMLGKM